MKRELYVQLLIGIVVAAAIVGGASVLARIPTSTQLTSRLAGPRSEDAGATSLSGDYQGSAGLQSVFPGVYTNVAVTPSPMDLGQIDLSLHLEQQDNTVTGYVMLDHTLVFTGEHTIIVTPDASAAEAAATPVPLTIGPRVQGTFDGTTLQLDSEPFALMLNDRPVTRRFRLISTTVSDEGATIEGQYYETIVGYAKDPSTVVGVFSLQRPIFSPIAMPPATPGPDATPTSWSYLPNIRK